MSDLLAMTALQFTKRFIEYETKDVSAALNEELKQINIELEEYIDQINT
jgi:hypothetical protein